MQQPQAKTDLGPGCSAPATIRQRDQCVVVPEGRELLHTGKKGGE